MEHHAVSENNGPVPPGDNPYRAPDQEPFARYRAPDQEPFAPYWAPQQPYPQPANPQYAAQPGPQLPYPGPAYPGPGQPYPPQPYGQPYGFAQPAPHNGMAIGALVVSIVAVLLAVIPFISVVGVGAAIVAVVLGFIGLRRTAAAGGRGMAIAGVAVGFVALVIGAVLTIVIFSNLDTIAEGITDAASPVAADTRNQLPDKADPAPAPLSDVADGPRGSTGSGGIPVGPEGVAGAVHGAAPGAVVVSVYVDYMCPYCGQFEQVNGPILDQLRGEGTIVVEYHPVSILDEASLGTAYSTRAAAAAALVADQAPEAFIAFNTALFATQPAENTTGLTDAEIAALARGAGAPEGVASTIESGAYLAGPGSFVNWVGAATDRAARDLGRLATPTVLIDGAPLNADWAVPGALAQAIADARG